MADRGRGPWVAVFASVWHGVTREGKIHLDLLSKQRPWQSTDKVYAIHALPAGLEMMVWEAMDHVKSISDPLMEALIAKLPKNESQAPLQGEFDRNNTLRVTQVLLEVDSAVDACVEKFCLNEDQEKTVRCISQWQLEALQETQETAVAPSSPICLIHGPFGTGKSSLLVAIIHLLTASRADVTASNELSSHGSLFLLQCKPMRVLMCAHTNKAVDRIMEGLLESGYTDFLRVGLLDKIARPVLPYALYYTSDTNENTGTAAELKRQLQNVQSPEEASILRHVLV